MQAGITGALNFATVDRAKFCRDVLNMSQPDTINLKIYQDCVFTVPQSSTPLSTMAAIKAYNGPVLTTVQSNDRFSIFTTLVSVCPLSDVIVRKVRRHSTTKLKKGKAHDSPIEESVRKTLLREVVLSTPW
jgi:hypothetical protein